MTVFTICKPMKRHPKCMICRKVFKTWMELTKHSKDEREQQKGLNEQHVVENRQQPVAIESTWFCTKRKN